MGSVAHEGAALLHDRAERWIGQFRAESEEVERGHDQHGGDDRQGDLHGERAEGVGRDMAEQDARAGESEAASGEDVIALALAQYAGARQPGGAGDVEEGDGDGDAEDAGAEDGDQQDGEDDAGEGEQDIDAAHDQGVGCASSPASGVADHDADQPADEDRGEAVLDGAAEADRVAREQVAREVVGAHRVVPADVAVFGTVAGAVGVGGVEQGEDKGEEEEQEQDGDGERAARLAHDRAELGPGGAEEAVALDIAELRRLDLAGGGCAAHQRDSEPPPMRMRGSSPT